jgi:hypothetical protein
LDEAAEAVDLKAVDWECAVFRAETVFIGELVNVGM